MDILGCLLSLLLLSPSFVHASGEDLEVSPRDKLIERQSQKLCRSTDEYIRTLKFLRTTKEIQFPESTARQIAEKVSRGCDGAAERFAHVLLLLKGVGLSDRQSLATALEFSSLAPETQKNFSEIFTRAYLNEFFDYEYALAVKLAVELSRDYPSDANQVREDFISLVRFCKDSKNLDLPAKVCAEYTVKLARLSQFHPNGIRQEFLHLFQDLRTRPEFLLDVKTALEIAYEVLKSGPRGPENFFKAYQYATSHDGLDLARHPALDFAKRMSERSFVGDKPPIVPPADFHTLELANAKAP